MNVEAPAALRPDAAAAFLSLSTQRLAKWRLTGGGPKYCKVGRSILYRREDISKCGCRRTADIPPATPAKVPTATPAPPHDPKSKPTPRVTASVG